MITTTTHLNFRGDARTALEFYSTVFGGEVTIATYGDFGMPKDVPGADKVVFGQVVTAEGFRVMAYDIPGQPSGSATTAGSTHRANGTTITTQPFFVSVRGETLAEIQGYWDKLSTGASIVEPLAASAWSPGFGMITDNFGVTWILDVAAAYAPAGSRVHAVAEEGVAFCEIARAIGDGLDLPIREIDADDAAEHFARLGGPLALLPAAHIPASSAITRELLDWHPTGPDVLTDLRSGPYLP